MVYSSPFLWFFPDWFVRLPADPIVLPHLPANRLVVLPLSVITDCRSAIVYTGGATGCREQPCYPYDSGFWRLFTRGTVVCQRFCHTCYLPFLVYILINMENILKLFLKGRAIYIILFYVVY